MTTSKDVPEDQYDDAGDDIELVDEKPLSWFDVSAMGTGEMLFTAGWAWIVFIASAYGIKWTIIGFVLGAIVINLAWWLYREMITAVPEPGMIQSFGREAGLFSLGSSYFILYAPVYGAFMWLELFVAKGLLSLLFPSVPPGIWPYVVILPVVGLNLLGHQITGKTQAVLVGITLVGDLLLAVGMWWIVADSGVWAANWESPSPVDWLTPFVVAGLWIGIMAGILEVQQVVVDEWRNFARSRDVGLLSAAYGLWARQIPLALAVLASAPLAALLVMPVPTVGVIQEKFAEYQDHPLFYLALLTMLIATYTTLSVFFMGMGRLVALYAQQGALPRVLARYSSRAVPWVAIVALAVFALIGVYWTNWATVVHILGAWAVTLYFVVALFYLRMAARKNLDRPLRARYGVPIAVVLLIYTGLIAFGIFALDWKAAGAWVVIVAVVVAYDKFVVPRTKRGGHYREQVMRRRTDATRL